MFWLLDRSNGCYKIVAMGCFLSLDPVDTMGLRLFASVPKSGIELRVIWPCGGVKRIEPLVCPA